MDVRQEVDSATVDPSLPPHHQVTHLGVRGQSGLIGDRTSVPMANVMQMLQAGALLVIVDMGYDYALVVDQAPDGKPYVRSKLDKPGRPAGSLLRLPAVDALDARDRAQMAAEMHGRARGGR